MTDFTGPTAAYRSRTIVYWVTTALVAFQLGAGGAGDALIATPRGKAGTGRSAFKSAVDAFGPLFFNGLVVVLDGCFVHRSRTIEGKDGNPLNEVRMLCNSILQHRGVLTADKTIKYNPSKSILKRQVGDEIKLTEADFVLLCTAF